MLTRSLTLAAAIAGLTATAALTAVRNTQHGITTPRQAAAPCTSTWSPHRAMMFGKGHIHIEAPQIVATRQGTAYLGDNAYAIAPTDSGFALLAGQPRGAAMLGGFLVRPDGAVVPIPGPPGVRAFIGVRATAHAGVAHVFWAGSADTSSAQWRHVNSLWYAQFDGERWTQPELILADTALIWMHQLTGVAFADGRAHLTTPVEGSTLVGDVLHVVRAAGGPGSATRLGFGALYTSLAAAPDGTLWLATIDGDRHDRARVLVRRSPDGGRSWSEPALVYRSGMGTAYDPRLAVTRDGSLYAAWIVEAATSPGRAESIYVAFSADKGSTWRPLPALLGVPDVRDLWAIADASGRLHLSFHSGERDGRVVGAMLEGLQWGSRFTFGPTPFAAILSAPDTEAIHLTWYEWQAIGPDRIPRIMVSRRRFCRDIPPER